MVRNISEIKKLIDQGKEDEITKEEIETMIKVIDNFLDLLTPLVDTLVNVFGQFLDLMERL